jgi:hypothetical protein
MPLVSAWFVRASLCHLVGGFFLGAYLLTSKGGALGGAAAPAALRGVHIEMLLVGWLIQLVMGVAIWIFPRFAVRQSPHRSAVTAWLAFGLLNAGVFVAGLSGVVLAGRLLEIAAAAAFAAHLWRRVSPAGLSGI